MEKYIKSPMNYTGGKYKLLPQIMELFPKNINTFYDIFAGGCNVLMNAKAKKYIANDYNRDIINIYRWFKDNNLDYIIDVIKQIINEFSLSKTNKDGFIELRNLYNSVRRLEKRETSLKWNLSAILFVLICYSFNHQIRFNSHGEFNMPFGKDRSSYNKSIEKNLTDFHNFLMNNNVDLYYEDFRLFLRNEHLFGFDDLVYCDPPYLITCASYNERNGWNEKDEKDLLLLLDNLNNQHIKFALSNTMESSGEVNKLLFEWSKKYNVHHLNNTYSNCSYHKIDRVSKDDEVLITNY